MAFTLHVVDWRDGNGLSHPEYNGHVSIQDRVDRLSTRFRTQAEAEAAAEAVWIEPDCKGVAPVCIVTEC